jgi:hypothetical protein
MRQFWDTRYLTVIFQMWEIISLDKFRIDQTMLPGKPQWALCLPDGCTTDDANLVGDFLLMNVIGNEVSVRFPDLLCQTVKEVNPPLTNGAIVTMYVAYYQILAFLSIFFQSYFSFVIINDMFCIFYGHSEYPYHFFLTDTYLF